MVSEWYNWIDQLNGLKAALDSHVALLNFNIYWVMLIREDILQTQNNFHFIHNI
jgi:hypothetical protein